MYDWIKKVIGFSGNKIVFLRFKLGEDIIDKVR